MATEYLRLSLTSFDRALRSNLRGGGLAALAVSSGGDASPSLGVVDRRPSRVNTPARRGSVFPGAVAVEGSEEALLGGGLRGGARYYGVVRLPWFIQLRRSGGYALHVALSVRLSFSFATLCRTR